jgi:hypothetical protein
LEGGDDALSPSLLNPEDFSGQSVEGVVVGDNDELLKEVTAKELPELGAIHLVEMDGRLVQEEQLIPGQATADGEA